MPRSSRGYPAADRISQFNRHIRAASPVPISPNTPVRTRSRNTACSQMADKPSRAMFSSTPPRIVTLEIVLLENVAEQSRVREGDARRERGRACRHAHLRTLGLRPKLAAGPAPWSAPERRRWMISRPAPRRFFPSAPSPSSATQVDARRSGSTAQCRSRARPRWRPAPWMPRR